MPIARFEMPDGRIARFEVPEGTTPAQAQAIGQQFMQSQAQANRVSQEASAQAAQGVGIPEAMLIAGGRGFDKAAMGLKQLALGGVKKFAPESFSKAAAQELAALSEQEAQKDSAYAGLQKTRPVSTGIGEAIPSVMATRGADIIPAAVGTAVVEALKYGTPQERAQRGAISGGSALVGGYVGDKVASLISPLASKAVSATQSEALKTAQKLGYKPRLSEVTGSALAARIEDVAARTPGGAGVMQDFAQANQKAINRRAAQGIGETADELTPKVFSDASKRLAGVFNEIKSLPGKTIGIGDDVAAAADDILRMQGKMIPKERDEALIALANQAKMLAANKGKIDGEAYQLLRSGLSNQAFEATGTNKSLYGKLLEAVDNSAEKSLTQQGKTQLAQALREARPQYGNLMTLERGLVAEGGDVSPARLASVLRQSNPKAFREGGMEGNPLYDVAKIGETLKPLKAGSPTYEREATSDVLSSLLRAGPAYVAAKATTSPLMTGYPTMLATNPMAQALAEPVSKLANPTSRALAAALAQRLLAGSAPVMAENQ